MADKSLQGRVAVITGASRGIGRAVALALGGAGARLALAGRAQDRLAETRRLARELGAEAETFVCDVREEAQVKKLVAEVIERFGGVHILGNNAGTAIRQKIHEFTLHECRTLMETNRTRPWP